MIRRENSAAPADARERNTALQICNGGSHLGIARVRDAAAINFDHSDAAEARCSSASRCVDSSSRVMGKWKRQTLNSCPLWREDGGFALQHGPTRIRSE